MRSTRLVFVLGVSFAASLAAACAENQFTLRVAEKSLCTDNAAMIGILAERKLIAGQASASLVAEIEPGCLVVGAGLFQGDVRRERAGTGGVVELEHRASPRRQFSDTA